MTVATTKLTCGWCLRSRGGVQVVKALPVAQGRTMPFLGKALTRSWRES